MKKYKNILISFLILLFACCFILPRLYLFCVLPDEFGYWANAACLNSFDWSGVVAHDAYYSYGYSLLLFPILKFAPSALFAYRCAILLNWLFVVAIFMISQKLLTDFKLESHPYAVLIVILIPGIIIYSMTTLTEVLLALIYVAIVFCLTKFENDNRLFGLLLSIILSCFIFFVHMRAIGVLIAMLFIVLHELKKKKISYFVYSLALLIVLIVGGLLFKTYIQNMLYIGNASTTDFESQFDKIASLLNVTNIVTFVTYIFGKLIYLQVASFGLFPFFIMQILNKHGITNLFVAISVICQILVINLFNYLMGTLDAYFSGRYLDYMLPVIIIVGLNYIYNQHKQNKLIPQLLSVLLITFTQLPILIGKTLEQGYMNIGIGVLGKSGVFVLILLSLVTMLMWNFPKPRNICLYTVITLEIVISSVFFNSFILRNNKMTKELYSIAETYDTANDIIYVEDDNIELLQPIQFILQDIPIVPKKTSSQSFD